ncbi:MAG TPA: hypothetical protein VLC09_17745 [Polyangiaceae bacterium]|nr:hypothetical protein [Polyangiaceae bacterium]
MRVVLSSFLGLLLTMGLTGGCSSEPSDTDDSSAGTGGGSGGPPPGLGDCMVFPASSPWNQDVSALPLHPLSDSYVDSIDRNAHVHPDFGTEWEGAPIGIPYVVVDSTQASVPIEFTAYGDESDPGPYPIPLDAPIEGGPASDGDRHVLGVDTSTCTLYELYRAFPEGDHWNADSGAVYDLTKDDRHPAGCTSADAAGLPIFPGLVRYDEVVEQGEIRHAIRFTVSRSQRAYVAPASHYASSDTDPNLPPMGLRLRMKAAFDCESFSDESRVVCTALKKFGLIVADNGSDWYLSGAPDSRWNDEALGDLKTIPGDAFEVVDTGAELVTDAPDCVIP